jgi:quercetin dioxygenase-like cupin family protein
LVFKNINDLDFEKSSHFGIHKKVIFNEREMSSSVTQIAFTELLAGDIVKEHSHVSMEEIFIVLEGSCEFVLNGISFFLKKEAVIKIAPNTIHEIRAISHSRLIYFGVAV